MIDVIEFRNQMRVKTTLPVIPQWMIDIQKYTYRAFPVITLSNNLRNMLQYTYHAFPVLPSRGLKSRV